MRARGHPHSCIAACCRLWRRVHLRNAESAVGVLPLNLTSCPACPQGAGAPLSPFAASLAAALEALAPRTLALPLAIDQVRGYVMAIT